MPDRNKYFKALIKDYFKISILSSHIKTNFDTGLTLGINEVWKLKNHMILDFVKSEATKTNKFFVSF